MVDASSTLRRAKNAFYPPALHATGPSSSRAEVAPKALVPSQATLASALLAPTVPSKEADQVGAMDKDKEPTKEKVPEPAKLPPTPKYSSKEKGASQGQVLVLAMLPFTIKEDPKGKGAA